MIAPGEAALNGSGLPQNDLDSRISALEASIQEMLTRYTEKWPDVISARDQLDQLYGQREKMLDGFSGSDVAIASNNPVYQNIRIALNDTNISIAELEGRLSLARARVADLQGKIDVIPGVEAKLAELTRDYGQISNIYDDMRAKYEQESLRRKRLGWDGVTFETMEPPRSSFDPVSPKRSLFLMAVAVETMTRYQIWLK